MTTTDDALALLAGLVLSDGRRWGQAATSVQWADARAVLDPDGPRRHWLGRARGYSKTTDTAGLSLAAMLRQLPAGSLMYAAAADQDQARLVMTALRGFVERTAGLRDEVDVPPRSLRATARRTGTVLEVLAADGAGSWGLLPSWLVLDELANWPASGNARTVHEALTSALVKVDGARQIVMTTSGDPSHWSRKVYDQAHRSPLWRVSDVAGPAPWQDPGELEEERQRLLPSSYARLFSNVWTASEDRLVDPADLDAAMTLRGEQPPAPGHRYVISCDIGLKNDATVVVVAHRVGYGDESRVVVDHLTRWRGTPANPVQLSDVETLLADLAHRYGARSYVDPWQASGLVQRLQQRGVGAEEFPFSTQSVGRLAMALYTLLRGRRLALPDDDVLREELLGVRLRESQPGQYRLDHDSSRHDDQAVGIALAAHVLLSAPPSPRLVLMDDEPEGVVPEQHPASVFAFGRGVLAAGGPNDMGDDDPDEALARVVGGQASPFVTGPGVLLEEELPPGGQRSPYVGGGDGAS